MTTESKVVSADPLSGLLDDFQRLPAIPPERPTFLQIIQCVEIHWSNILAFFLEPTNVHGNGSAFLDALLKKDERDEGCGPLSGVIIEREHSVPAVPTMRKGRIEKRKGRIDLYIESDQYLIAVENKISSPVFGDQLKRYSEYVDSRASEEDLEPVKILLTLKDPGLSTDQLWGFRPLRYESLVERVSKQGNVEDPYYGLLRKDLLATLKKLKGSSVMKPIHIKFFKERTKEIMSFLAAIDEFRKVLRTKISDLKSLMDMSRYSNVRPVPVKAAKAINLKSIDARLRYEINLARGPRVEPVKVRVFAVISADGWKFQFRKFGRGCTRDELRALLYRCFPQGFAVVRDGNSFIEATTFPFDEELPTVQAHYEQRIGTLANKGSAALQKT